MNTLEEWIRTVSVALGVGEDVDRDLVLDLARIVAHNVARPAAPLTTFIAGMAVGRAGGDAEAVRTVIAKIAALAQGYTSPDGE